MRLKPECPHRGEKMCSCAAIQSEDPLAQITYLFGSIQEPKEELDYTTLASPHPYRLCLSGACEKCGGRLCISLDEPGDLSGDDFLTAVYRHLYQVFNANFGMWESRFRRIFTELFHEQDRPYIRHWLGLPENKCASRMYRRTGKGLPEQGGKAAVHTIVQTAADVDQGFFPDPIARGSYFSIDRARERLAELIAEEKKTLSSRYDKEELSEDCWETYEDGNAAARFVRIEILSSEVSPELEGGPGDA